MLWICAPGVTGRDHRPTGEYLVLLNARGCGCIPNCQQLRVHSKSAVASLCPSYLLTRAKLSSTAVLI